MVEKVKGENTGSREDKGMVDKVKVWYRRYRYDREDKGMVDKVKVYGREGKGTVEKVWQRR